MVNMDSYCSQEIKSTNYCSRAISGGSQSDSHLSIQYDGLEHDSKISDERELDEPENVRAKSLAYESESHSGNDRTQTTNLSLVTASLAHEKRDNLEGKSLVLQLISTAEECDTLVNVDSKEKGSTVHLEMSAGLMGEHDLSDQQQRKYFSYEPPLYEETGTWIPISVPPMTEQEHEEWTKGFISNGGYIPDEGTGWCQHVSSNKELTMWDVVVEMLLAAGEKMRSFASGDILEFPLVSANLIEHAWKEMAQTLSEVNLSSTHELLESEPPKWLADSMASSCMLCSMHFHPIMCTRHHCRFCGGLFCGECTKGRSLLPEKFRTGDPQRVCDVCYVRLKIVQPYLMDQVSRAAQLPTNDVTDLSTLRSWVNFPWGQTMEYEIYKATNIIHAYAKVGSLKPEKKIPKAILRHAKGLAILTVIKVGMMVTYNIGTGLVVARREDGSWSPPSAISTFGFGWGAQAGGELTDFILVLRTYDAVKNFCDAHFALGAGFSAAVGPSGRTAEADVRAGVNGFATCYTYSCSKGAFIGCSLEGSLVMNRGYENSRFYGSQSLNAADILVGSMAPPPAAAVLYRALADLYMQLDK